MCSVCDGKVTVRVYDDEAYPVWYLSEHDFGTEIEMTQAEYDEWRLVSQRWKEFQILVQERAEAKGRT